jgi:hypothetical protein
MQAEWREMNRRPITCLVVRAKLKVQALSLPRGVRLRPTDDTSSEELPRSEGELSASPARPRNTYGMGVNVSSPSGATLSVRTILYSVAAPSHFSQI